MRRDLLGKQLAIAQDDGGDGVGVDDFFDVETSAWLMRDAGCGAILSDDVLWRRCYLERVRQAILRRALRFLRRRKGASVVIWTHNSGVGDMRYTGVGESKLCKEHFGSSC